MIGDNVAGYEPPDDLDIRKSTDNNNNSNYDEEESNPPQLIVNSKTNRFSSFTNNNNNNRGTGGSFSARPAGPAALFEKLAETDGAGGAQISLVEIRKKLAEASHIRARRSADFRYSEARHSAAMPTTMSPIIERIGVQHSISNSSNTTTGEAIEMDGLGHPGRSQSVDDLERLRARSHSAGFLNAL